jgi:hypothetical protein
MPEIIQMQSLKGGMVVSKSPPAKTEYGGGCRHT